MEIEIFTGPNCSYCEAAKRLLRERRLSFTECEISAPEAMAEFQRRLPRQKSLPQIFIDGEHIGGFEDLRDRLAG